MEILKYKLKSVTPIIMHNGQLANPMNYYTREIAKITSKRKKVQADYEELARLEWYGGLYLTEDKSPCLPGANLEGALVRKGSAARRNRMGQQAASGLIVEGDFPLTYDGPKDIGELWEDERFSRMDKMTIGTSSVMRCRPTFPEWETTVEVLYIPTQINGFHVDEWMELVGREIGIGDWRPKFGRFAVEKL